MDTNIVLYALPIGLFFVNLIIISIVRFADKSSRNLANVKKLVDQYTLQIQSADSSFKQELAELDAHVGKKTSEVRNLIQTCTTQINMLESYSDDLNKLGSAMQSYKVALSGLQKLTENAQLNVDNVKSDVNRLEDVHLIIENFRNDLKEAEKELIEQEKKVIILERDSLEHLEDASHAAEKRVDTALEEFSSEFEKLFNSFSDKILTITDKQTERIENVLSTVSSEASSYISELDCKLEATREAADSLNSRSVSILENMGNRTEEEHLLASQLVELEQKRNVLARQLSSFEDQIREKSYVAREMNELSQKESDNLYKIREEIKELENYKKHIEESLKQSQTDSTIQTEVQKQENETEKQQCEDNLTCTQSEDEQTENEQPGIEESEIEQTENETIDADEEFENQPLEEKTEENTEVQEENELQTENMDSNSLDDEDVDVSEQKRDLHVEYTGEDEEVIF